AAQEAFIDSVHYAGHTGISLSWLTQNQRPWVKVRQLNQLGARELCTEIIQIEDIRRYFIDLDQTQRRSEQGRSLNPFNPVTM
uniref:hypothetical protein n=1 Tax=Arthrobacter sp. H20 TaxID=1267981 RepID=UPI0005644C78